MSQDAPNLRRRRARTIAFFDHGEGEIHRSSIPTGPGSKRNVPAAFTNARSREHLNELVDVKKTIVAIGIILFVLWAIPQIVLQFCDTSLSAADTGVCRLISMSKRAVIPVKCTPLTRTLYHVARLNEKSAALEFIGLAMHTTTANVTILRGQLREHEDDFPGSGDTFAAAVGAQTIVQQFSDAEYTTRHDVLTEKAFARMHGALDEAQLSLNRNYTLLWTAKDFLLSRTPFLTTQSLSHMVENKLAAMYHQIALDQGMELNRLVTLSSEAVVALRQFSTRLRMFQEQLNARMQLSGKSVSHLDPEMFNLLQPTVTWALDVIEFAQSEYRSLLTEAVLLDNRFKAGNSILLRNPRSPTRRMRELLNLERQQLARYADHAGVFEEITAEIVIQLMEPDDDEAHVVRWKLESAIAERELQWW